MSISDCNNCRYFVPSGRDGFCLNCAEYEHMGCFGPGFNADGVRELRIYFNPTPDQFIYEYNARIWCERHHEPFQEWHQLPPIGIHPHLTRSDGDVSSSSSTEVIPSQPSPNFIFIPSPSSPSNVTDDLSPSSSSSFDSR